MEESRNEDVKIDQKYVESGDAARVDKKSDVGSWGFYALVGCVLFALYEIVSSIIYFFK